MSLIYVGMSGGVDSSAAAWLLKEQGHEIVGVTFVALNEQGSKKCCSLDEINAAREVCAALGVPHKTVNLKDVFEARIIRGFINDYGKGRTPNPCVLCNRYIKFGALLDYSLSQGADAFATGHYARIEEYDGELFVRCALDSQKDQSYFLSYIDPDMLPYVRLPLGDMKKSQTREVILKAGLPISPHKNESQDICFVKDDYRDFLISRGVVESPGEFVLSGQVVGTHRGISFYSFGQRRGLGISAGRRLYVRNFDTDNNRVLLGEKPMSKRFTVRGLNIFSENFCDGTYGIQTRYQSKKSSGQVRLTKDGADVELNEAREIIAPGQLAVMSREGRSYASGFIERVEVLDKNT